MPFYALPRTPVREQVNGSDTQELQGARLATVMSQPNDRDQEAGSGDYPGPQYMGRAAIAHEGSV
ncbi:hypothetical protein PG988_004784 [Apiospora saccharicola]